MTIQNNALIALQSEADLSGKKGYFIKSDNSGKAVAVSSATDIPFGAIVEGFPSGISNTIALHNYSGTVEIQVTDTSAGSIKPGSYLQLESDGTVKKEASSGARIVVARAFRISF